MVDEIAVIVDEDGETTFIQEFGKIILYQKLQDTWVEKREIQYTIDISEGMQSIRQSLLEIVKSLGDCRIVVGSEISGVFYNILDTANFKIWEFEGGH